MIERMTKYSFVLLDRDREGFLEKLQGLGLVDITRSAKPVDEHSSRLFDRISRQKTLIAEITSGRDEHLRTLQGEVSQLQATAEEMRVWGSWDREKLASTGIGLHFYKVASKHFDPAWQEQYPLLPVAEISGQSYFVIAGPAEGFPLKELPAPKKDFSGSEKELEEKRAETAAYQKALEGRRSELPGLRKEMARMQDELSLYLASVTGEPAAGSSLVVFEGFAPEEKAGELEKSFEGMEALWLSEKASSDDNPPIKLKNDKFTGMFEVLTDMYGRPGYDGFDPTVFISIFFTLFFAFCMGDAGYGFVILLLGFLLRKKPGTTSKLIMTLGVATIIIGFLFHSFFSMDISKWGFIRSLGLNRFMMPSDSQCVVPGMGSYDWNMILALACGVLHISLAQITKAVVATRNNGFMKSVGVWGWTLLIVGGVTVGVLALLKLFDTAAAKIAIIVIGVISGLCIFFLRDLRKNPLINVGNGLWETYNTATGLLSDVLSYLRLYALALAGSLLGGAFNDLATMVRGDGGIGWVFFVLLVVIGHTLNIAMSGLSAFVHPLRLNFLEFFKNAGYEGVGRDYAPLSRTNQNINQ